MALHKPASNTCFGDVSTADVLLELLSCSTDCAPLKLHLHSSVLIARSEYFQALLSERWRVEDSRPIDLTLPNRTKDLAVYKRCIELMYVSDEISLRCFTSVGDALDMLEVAAELLFRDCLTACMTCLGALPWSCENETAIRSCFATLHLQITTPDLAARLSISPDCNPVKVTKDLLERLLVVVDGRWIDEDMQSVTKELLDQIDASKVSAASGVEVNVAALYKTWHNTLNEISSTMRSSDPDWCKPNSCLVSASAALKCVFSELLHLNAADAAVKTFAENTDLPRLVIKRREPIGTAIVGILELILLAFERLTVIIPISVRLALFQQWWQVPNISKTFNASESLIALLQSLPQADQLPFYKTWISKRKPPQCWTGPDLKRAFEDLAKRLRLAIEQDNSSVE